MGKQKEKTNVTYLDPFGQAAAAVDAFAEKWISLPTLSMPCQVMDIGQLRDAMGIYATIDNGDSWPLVEKLLRERGFSWHQLGGSRVMYLRNRDELVDSVWQNAEEVDEV